MMSGESSVHFFGGFMWLFWLVILVIVVIVLKLLAGGGQQIKESSALDELDHRYARGEIDDEEYQKKRKLLKK